MLAAPGAHMFIGSIIASTDVLLLENMGWQAGCTAAWCCAFQCMHVCEHGVLRFFDGVFVCFLSPARVARLLWVISWRLFLLWSQ
ncbi:hypothetical protein COO60DRAFT_802888 [Scenedesmus sp. NREL 46B-D3]|nr:hypothetical protein COO60DRAFT_802888 [Scenedesmus sp. NREL 46B-D3]